MTNKVVHFEIPFDDSARAHKFYAEAFGWSLTDTQDPPYTIAGTGPANEYGQPSEPGYINGGLFQRAAGGEQPQRPVITIDVPDIDKALATIESLGGKTAVPSTPIPGMGAYAYFTDTEGNLLGLFEVAPQG